MKSTPQVISNLTVSIIHYFYVRHDVTWQEHWAKFEYTLWCVRRGNIYINVEGKDYFAKAGDSVVFYPGKVYSAHTDAEGCEFMVVRFKLEMGNHQDIMDYINVSGIVTCLAEENDRLLENLTTHVHDNGRHDLHRYYLFMNYIIKFIEHQLSDDATLFYASSSAQMEPFIQDSIDYISTNYRTVTVKDAAEHCGFNEKRFITLFKQSVGMSPGQYIVQQKMQKATSLLCDTDKKLVEIATYLGYADQYSFSRAFKQYYKKSPLAFRDSMRAQQKASE